ncbi:hypothetical protein D3C87_1824260 [compost metagenome]
MHKVFGPDNRNQTGAVAIAPIVLRTIGVKPAVVRLHDRRIGQNGFKNRVLVLLIAGAGAGQQKGNK